MFCTSAYLEVGFSSELTGTASVAGSKNGALAILAPLLLTSGVSCLKNVPASADVLNMLELLRDLGADTRFCDDGTLEVDTTNVCRWQVSPSLMRRMRASVCVMGPLLARFGRADIAMPGGCVIGARPINYHLQNFERMGVEISRDGELLRARTAGLQPCRFVLEYPSVGATQNILAAAVLAPGRSQIVNAALEPEVLDLIDVLKKMGARVEARVPATIEIEGVEELRPVQHTIMADRLEAGVLLLAAAMTGGSIELTRMPAHLLDLFLVKLEEMGHHVRVGDDGDGISLQATTEPRAVSLTTRPYPGFPTDLQAPMLAAQCLAEGTGVIIETVYENRLSHVRELCKLGAQIDVRGRSAHVTGVSELYGAPVIASDIRASAALVLAGLAARGTTRMTGLHHWRRGYACLEKKLNELGANIKVYDEQPAQIVPSQERTATEHQP